jgi:chloride channel 3/4/5
LTGIAVGVLATGIVITTDWLGDLKAGYCSIVGGGAFYLNKGFCCLLKVIQLTA